MPLTVLSKGLEAGWTEGETSWGDHMNHNLRKLNAWIAQAWAHNPETSVALTYGYKGGPKHGGGYGIIPDGTVALTPNATNYVQRNAVGMVSVSTVGFGADQIPMAVVVTDGVSTTSITDAREFIQIGAGGQVFVHSIRHTQASTRIIVPGTVDWRDASDIGNLMQLTQDGDLGVSGRLNGALNADHIDQGVLGSQHLVGAYDLITRVGLLEELAVAGKAYTPRVNMGEVSGAVLLNAALSNAFRMRLIGNVTSVGISNASPGQGLILEIEQDAVGNRTVAWGGGYRPESGTYPELTTTASKIDLVSIYYNGAEFLLQHNGTNF
jgi:hypothetical protein